MKVSMIPDNSVKMIHASQDDVGRKWEFELYDEDGLIDVSSVGEQMVYPVYQGGTEQILPENTSTPTTSPIIADIVYPDETRTDQEFLYRECPSVEDGQARIKRIKGNTVKFNQLVENGNFAVASGWTGQFATVTISNGIAYVKQDRAGDYVALRKSNLQGLSGHKYYVTSTAKCNKKTTIAFYLSGASTSGTSVEANTITKVSNVFTIQNANDGGFNIYTNRNVELEVDDVVEVHYVMLFDLTAMGMDNYTAEQFEAWLSAFYSLPYYAHTQGTLLPFMGESIKTTGKNFFDVTLQTTTIYGQTYTVNADKSITLSGTPTANTTVKVGEAAVASALGIVTVSGLADTVNMLYDGCYLFNSSGIQIGSVLVRNKIDFTVDLSLYPDVAKITIYVKRYADNVAVSGTYYPMVTIGTSVTSYEPYVESIVNLPILNYFADGMKSAEDVFDELTENSATQRLKKAVLGELDWEYFSGSGGYFRTLDLTDIKPSGAGICSKYEFAGSTSVSSAPDLSFIIDATRTRIYIKDSNYTDATTFKQMLTNQNVVLYYELNEPVETPIASASLIYKVFKGGTEQILPINTSSPSTAPIICDIQYPVNIVTEYNTLLSSVAQVEVSPSKNNYSVGDYLMYNNQLYKVISAITTGSSLVVNTNIQATTIMAELLNLL